MQYKQGVEGTTRSASVFCLVGGDEEEERGHFSTGPGELAD